MRAEHFLYFNNSRMLLPLWESVIVLLARGLRAKFWPDCAIPDTSMKFGTVVDHVGKCLLRMRKAFSDFRLLSQIFHTV